MSRNKWVGRTGVLDSRPIEVLWVVGADLLVRFTDRTDNFYRDRTWIGKADFKGAEVIDLQPIQQPKGITS